VLAGGRSRRFGSDKRLASFRDETMVASACRRVSMVVDGILIAATGHRVVALPGTSRGIIVRDDPPGRGPLGGLSAALARCAFGAVVLAVDQPLVRVATLARLVSVGRITGSPAAVRTRAGWEPLVAFYPRSALNDVRAALSQGSLALHVLLDRWPTVAVEPIDVRELCNVNTRNELTRIDAAPKRA
jgi:molybdopterin-guanine dinucleotide biosynthesis protein A